MPPATINRCSVGRGGNPFPSGPQTASWSPGASLASGTGQLSDDQIDDVDSDRLASRVEHGVVKCQRAGQQRIVARCQADHEKLARQNPPGDFRSMKRSRKVSRASRMFSTSVTCSTAA